MYKLFLPLILFISGLFFLKASPVNNPNSVYNILKTQSEKCPYLRDSVLKTEPQFLIPCRNFSRIISLSSIADDNVHDARCTIYYNNYLLLCYWGNLTQEVVTHYFDKDKKEASLKNNTIETVCTALKNENREASPVKKSMDVIVQYMQVEQTCKKICNNFLNEMYPICNEAAYMLQIISAREKSSQIPVAPSAPVVNKNKTLESPHTNDQQQQQQLSPDINKPSKTPTVPTAAIFPKPLVNDKESEAPEKIQPTHTESQKLPSNIKATEGNEPVKTDETKASDPNTKLNETGKDKSKIEEQPHGNNEVKTEMENNKAAETNKPKDSTKNEPAKEVEPSKNLPDSNNEVATASVSEFEEVFDRDGARIEEYQEVEEDPKKAEIKPEEAHKVTEVKKEPEVKHETHKPEETVDDEDDILPANYNQHLDENDSYFFSYFMMICAVFILGYVAYHNKQKVFALVLEGRRGRRPSRSRRPNSANYHKLDSNLEEAVTSSVNKNTTQIIY